MCLDAVQIAKSVGANVTGVCSTTKVDFVRSLGADHVIEYTSEDFAEGEQRYDVILDTGGHSSLSPCGVPSAQRERSLSLELKPKDGGSGVSIEASERCCYRDS